MVNLWCVVLFTSVSELSCPLEWFSLVRVNPMPSIRRSILNDPQVYPAPDKFVPERFLKDGKLNTEIRDPAAYVFGFGPRCGRYNPPASVR